jgi:hypothetical protein
MTKAKGRPQRERRLAEISGEPEDKEAQEAVEDEEGIQYEYPIYLSNDSRAFLRFVIGPRNQLLGFALIQQVQIRGTWHDVVRYDSHKNVHVHIFSRNGEELKKEVCDLAEIDSGFETAKAAILDGWEQNRRRYLHG